MNRKTALTFLLSCCSFFVFAQSYPFKNFNSTNGLTVSTVYDCFQDSKGYMWFGTETGAVRFDGKNFRQYTIDDGLSDNEIFSVNEDSQGRIWFLTYSGRPSYLRNDTFYNASNDPALAQIKSERSLHMFMEDDQQRIWIGSLGKEFFVLTGEKVKHYHILNDTTLSGAVSFIKNNGEVWICIADQFFRIAADTLQAIDTRYRPITFRTITNDNQGNILLLAKEGLVEMRGTKEKLIVPREKLHLPWSLIGALYVDMNGNLWIPSIGDGVRLFNKTKDAYAFGELFLSGKIVSAVTCDHEGNYWFPTVGNGVYMLPSNYKNYRSYTTAEGLVNNYVYSICKDDSGRIWAGMNRGYIHVIAHGKVKTFDVNYHNTNYLRTVDIVKDHDGAMWVVTDRSVVKFASFDDAPKPIIAIDSPYYIYPKNIDVAANGKISVTNAMGVVRIVPGKKGYMFQRVPGFQYKRTFTHHFDAKGNLWVANIEGLNCYTSERLIKYGEANDLLKKRITDIKELNNDVLVLSTYGHGIIFFSNGKIIKHITTKEGLSSNICKKMFIDKNKNIWVATNKGVSKIFYSTDGFFVEKFTTYNGLLSDDVNDIYVDSSEICIATSGGLSIISDLQRKVNGRTPPVLINRVMSDNDDITKQSGIRLSYDHNRILIDYIALSYSDPLELIYQYRLNGNLRWETTRNTSVEFSSLNPGEYKFELRAKKANGSWSKPVTFAFTIVPPIWLNLYYMIPLLVIFVAAVIFIIRYRIIRTRLKQTERLKIQNKMIQLEQQALQAMMNPHFIFNVMNSIQNYLNSHDQFAVNQYLSNFAKLIRKNMDIATESYITLEEEIAYLNLYLSLEKLRFEDQLIYTIEKEEQLDADEIIIPSMILQPFIENAIWHGIMPLERTGIIRVQFRRIHNELHIEISDNGIGINNSVAVKSRKKEHISRGVSLVTERVQLINQTTLHPISIHIAQNDNPGESGTIVIIKLPLHAPADTRV